MKLGIICAMKEEALPIVGDCKVVSAAKALGTNIYGCVKGNVDIVVAICGVGKTNAAMITQYVIDTYHPHYIINTGIGGSLSEDLNIGDIAISDRVRYHDVDVTALGYKLGEVPDMDSSRFDSDAKLYKLAQDSCGDLHHKLGTIVSGDMFVGTAEQKRLIKDLLPESSDVICCEMEGASIGHTCALNKVPFVVIRSISDNANGHAEVDYPTFKSQAIKNSYKIVKGIIEKLSKEK